MTRKELIAAAEARNDKALANYFRTSKHLASSAARNRWARGMEK